MRKFFRAFLDEPLMMGLMGFALVFILAMVWLIFLDRRNQRKYLQWLERRRRTVKERAAKRAAMRGP